MKMPERIKTIMFAPCGMNCAVCYQHVGIRKKGQHCEGCLQDDYRKPAHCRNCKIKSCAQDRGHAYCFVCDEFPCKFIKNLEKSYRKRYATSLVENSQTAQGKGIDVFLEQDRIKWTCKKCGGAFSLHDGMCSECGYTEN